MSFDMHVPVEQVLADIDDRIATLVATATALRELYGLPEALEVTPPTPRASAPSAAVDTPTPRRRRSPRPVDEVAAEAAPADDQEVDGKYDAVIRRVLREAGEVGAAAIDIAIAWLPTRYDADDKKTALAGVYAALKSFERRGLVAKDGRIWKWHSTPEGR